MTPPTHEETRVLREWRATAAPDRLQTYRHHLVAHVLPDLEALPGFLGVRMLTRDLGGAVEITVLTTWRSLADIAAFAGTDITRAVVEPEAQAVLLEFDEHVRHYRLVEDR